MRCDSGQVMCLSQPCEGSGVLGADPTTSQKREFSHHPVGDGESHGILFTARSVSTGRKLTKSGAHFVGVGGIQHALLRACGSRNVLRLAGRHPLPLPLTCSVLFCLWEVAGGCTAINTDNSHSAFSGASVSPGMVRA